MAIGWGLVRHGRVLPFGIALGGLVLMAIASRILGVPVRWTETRVEHMTSTTHGRAQVTDLEAAVEADGTISGGMLPKLAGAIDAAKSGVNAVHVVDGRVPHALLLEILTDQAYGTMIRSL